jgi:hypothetical protein
MKNLLVLFLITTFSVGAQNIVVECGQPNTIYHKSITVVDTLRFTCAKTLLIQDSAVLYVFKVEGSGLIKRGGIGGAPTINGIDRFVDDANPMVVLVGCEGDFSNVEIGSNIDLVTITELCNDE